MRDSTQLPVAAIVNYLVATGWRRQPAGWNGGAIWSLGEGFELLVPSRDGMGDGDRRVREILRCLSAAEDRASAEIAREIASPLVDTQLYRANPAGHASGYTALTSGVRMIHGIQELLRAAARVAADGPHVAFTGKPPASVQGVLRRAELGPATPGSFVVSVRMPATTRPVVRHLHQALTAVHGAVESGSPAAFDATVAAGVSAELCLHLSDLAGQRREEPFDVTFRWAHGRPEPQRQESVTFPTGSGALIRSAARRLRSLHDFGEGAITGLVESLHDDPERRDRWRVRIRGELRTGTGDAADRAMWVRMPTQDAYDAAMTAHRQHRALRARGRLVSRSTRVELTAHVDGIAISDTDGT